MAVAALQTDRLYIDPNVTIPPADRSQLQSAVDDCATPLFLTLLPAGDTVTVQVIHSGLGQPGVYAVLTGSHFTAAATGGLLPTGRANQLALQATTKPSRTAGLVWFIQEVNQETQHDAAGSAAPAAQFPNIIWDVSEAGTGAALLLAAWAIYRSRRKRNARQSADMEAPRAIVDEDITQFGEELERLRFDPRSTTATDEMRAAYSAALDQFENAKRATTGARHSREVTAVTSALEEGHYALAALDALRLSRPRPMRRPPCFFDPSHGPSTRDVGWAPTCGVWRMVPACAACTVRVQDGQEPLARQVRTHHGVQPFWKPERHTHPGPTATTRLTTSRCRRSWPAPSSARRCPTPATPRCRPPVATSAPQVVTSAAPAGTSPAVGAAGISAAAGKGRFPEGLLPVAGRARVAPGRLGTPDDRGITALTWAMPR